MPVEPFCCCFPWRLRVIEEIKNGPAHPSFCCFCGTDVAAPEKARGKHVACIYCGLDRDIIPAIDQPILPEPEI